jgi:hypothetical protein
MKPEWTITNCIPICSFQIQFDGSIDSSSNELFIPARSLVYGICELKLTVTTVELTTLTSSVVTYIKIIPSNIVVNLVKLGTSMIISGHQQDLNLDPGLFSVNPDVPTFNSDVYLTIL